MSSSSSSCWSQQLINMPVIYKRVVIGFLFFFFVFFLLLTRDQSGNGSMETVTATALQLQQQLQPSGQNEANQIEHVPSQSSPEHLSGNFSSIFNSSYSVDKAYTLASTSTPSPQASPIISSAVSTSITTSSSADAQQLIDLHNFAYLMEQPACEAHIVILILVHTAPGNTKKRSLIRQTWGMPQMTQGNSPLRLVFLLGAVQPHTGIQHQLEEENARYMDMVQGNFHDAYRNMTYKHVMALKWFNQYCPHAQFLIKADDDVFVNTPQLLKLLGDPVANLLLQQHQHELLLCRPEMKSAVKRTYRSKWRVSFKEYRERYYPPYCPGFGIIYSEDVVKRLYQAAQLNDYFWIDDVFVTGVLAQQTNTTITNLQPYVLYEENCKRLLNGESEWDHQEFLFTWHSITQEQIRELWQLYLAQNNTLSQANELGTVDTGVS